MAAYNVKKSDKVSCYGTEAIFKVLKTPEMDNYFTKKGVQFGWITCEVIKEGGRYKIGSIHEMNGDFLNKI